MNFFYFFNLPPSSGWPVHLNNNSLPKSSACLHFGRKLWCGLYVNNFDNYFSYLQTLRTATCLACPTPTPATTSAPSSASRTASPSPARRLHHHPRDTPRPQGGSSARSSCEPASPSSLVWACLPALVVCDYRRVTSSLWYVWSGCALPPSHSPPPVPPPILWLATARFP